MLKPLRLSFSNSRTMLNAFFIQGLTLLLALAIAFVAFGGYAQNLVDLFQQLNLDDFVAKTIQNLTNPPFNSEAFAKELSSIMEQLRQGIESLRSDWGSAELAYIMFFAVIILYRILVAFTDVAVGYQLEEFMTSNARRPFLWFLFKKQKETWIFAIWQCFVALMMDILIIFGTAGIYLLFLVAFRWWTIIPAVLIGVILYAMRLTFTAFTLPAVVCGAAPTPRLSFRAGLSKVFIRFWRVFYKTFIVVFITFALWVVSALFVQNPVLSMLLTTVPSFLLFFYLKCINMCEYFENENRPYFYKVVEVEGTERYNRKHKIK
ncbi:MAG: hypothetical protein IJ032_04760 [Clostridia bacterium]|nr:hypothetical protein [Clostridia bacterium]